MTIQEQRKAARDFAKRWAGRGYEKGETQLFWTELIQNIFGVDIAQTGIKFEYQVPLHHTSFIDAYLPHTRVLIEQKSLGINLSAPAKQSDGSSLTPYGQAKRYDNELPLDQKARWIIACNFEEFEVHDMNHPHDAPVVIKLKDLEQHWNKLSFLISEADSQIHMEQEVSIKAGALVGKLYDMLLPQYRNPEDAETLKQLNKLCVRIVFCLYAEDSALFGRPDAFHDYLAGFMPKNVRIALIDLFRTLDTKIEDRDPYMDEALASFPYVNGGLFKGDVEIPTITPEIHDLILNEMSLGFDWHNISPTIFGAVFESTLNPETRRSGGMHYTSIENIHKVIDPLFLDELKEEFRNISEIKVAKTRNDKLAEFQNKIAGLKFLDPACGSGNFLTETYLSLRRLENKVIQLRYGEGATFLGGELSPIKVDITQLYGIEINDFAVSVAQTALWIAEAQMMHETENIVGASLNFFPLTTNAGIVEGNALRMDWNEVIHASELNYIMGNPPFVGARMKTKEQASDLEHVFGAKWKNLGNMDYVCGWYKLASDYIRNTNIHVALVSTNSITQGEQVANLWKPLLEDGIRINFAYKTFRWDSEASLKAHVHCVIVGFSRQDTAHPFIVNEKGKRQDVRQINPYLVDADPIFVESRTNPLCNVPQIGIGNKPIDGGNYLFNEDEMREFIRKEPKSEQYFRKWWGAEEFIHQKPRYCLWLGDCSPAELRSMPLAMERVRNVVEYRLQSPSEGTRKLAERPTRFHVENMPESEYIIIPSTSSERRVYIPIGYLPPEDLTSNAVHIIPDATLYHFGVLTSSVHMAWMRVVCGRLEMRYRYSKDIVYNNFPWPQESESLEERRQDLVFGATAPKINPAERKALGSPNRSGMTGVESGMTAEQKAKIEQTAQDILDARAHYPDSSLADLYDPLTMPNDLRTAHRLNDQAVLEAYGFPRNISEPEIVAKLFEMYQELTKQSQ